MNNGKVTSLKKVMWKILNRPIVKDITYEEVAELTLDYLSFLGAPFAYEEKTTLVEINNHKGEIPCDLIELRGIRYLPEGISSNNAIAMRYASNIYHISELDDPLQEFTYIVQKGIIKTSVNNGIIEVAYRGVMMDGEGFPLIPDTPEVVRGIEYYVIYMYLENLWTMGKITDKVFSYYEQKYLWYKGVASASLRMLTMDQMETVMNGINRLIVSSTMHSKFFSGLGGKEMIKRYV